MNAPTTFLTSTDGQRALPRYFAHAFARAQKIGSGRLDVILPDGRRFRAQGTKPGPAAELYVHDPDFFARLLREGDLGFAEAYLDGGWSTPDLQGLLDLISSESAVYNGFPAQRFVQLFERLRHLLRANTRRQAKRNIAYHYDLGNDFYVLWLDESMTYSSALFLTGQESLERAQEQKYARILEKLALREGAHLLEIGCGWGGFAEFAARRGYRVTALTISPAQFDYAVKRIARAGLTERAQILLCDYRDARGEYDAVASIEMFEAVGERYWPVYFRTVHDRLRPGGNAVIQVITVPDANFNYYRRNIDFIQKYIFPGGMLICPSRFRSEAEKAGLRLAELFTFGQSYSETLRRWYHNFTAAWERIQSLGFDERFRRMWSFYLTSCASAFRVGTCDVAQIRLTRPV